MSALEILRDDLRETDRELASTFGEVQAIKAWTKGTEKRLDKLETLSAKLLTGVLTLSAAGGIAGQLALKFFGG